MPTLTIPENILKESELVIIPRKEYKEFSEWKTAFKPPAKYKTFKPTLAQKRALKRARKNLAEGKFLTIDELKKKLGFSN